MSRDRIMRRTLAVGAIFNFLAATIVLFPDPLRPYLDLPTPGARFFPWMLALFIGLFGGVYAWLSRSRIIDRSLITLATIGKIGVFVIAFLCWRIGDISIDAFAPAVGDLAFGLVFLWWLLGARPGRHPA